MPRGEAWAKATPSNYRVSFTGFFRVPAKMMAMPGDSLNLGRRLSESLGATITAAGERKVASGLKRLLLGVTLTNGDL